MFAFSITVTSTVAFRFVSPCRMDFVCNWAFLADIGLKYKSLCQSLNPWEKPRDV